VGIFKIKTQASKILQSSKTTPYLDKFAYEE